MNERRALLFITIAIAIDMLSFGIVAPVFPKLVRSFVGDDTATAARIYGVFGTVFALAQFVCAPILGVLSDRIGRRPVLLASILGLGADYVAMALAPNLAWLFVGRVISGVTAASVATAMAYISDVTPEERRSGAFGLISAAFGIGFVIGPAIGGVAGAFDARLPFWIAAGASLLNAAFGFFVLRESLPRERRARRFDWARANPLGALRLLRSHSDLYGLAGVNFIGYVAHEAYIVVFVLYGIDRYGWNTAAVGLVLALVGITSALVSALFVRPIAARLGDRSTMVLGITLGTIGFVMLGLAPTTLWFCAGVVVNALWGLAGPTAQSLMTRHVGPSEQGELQGALSSVRGVAMLIGPAIFAVTYSAGLQGKGSAYQPGAPWYLAGAMLAVSALIALRVSARARAPFAAETV